MMNPTSKASSDPYDINGANFNPELYLHKIFRESSLQQIMEKESEIIRDSQSLHSDMQTLVYENYNKFISATDTIRKMKNDFKEMETEMDLLASNMESIASFSQGISNALQDTRSKLTKLTSIHGILKQLQFLFRLPHTLKQNVVDENYGEAVTNYTQAQKPLEKYKDTQSFHGIQSECDVIMNQVKSHLYSVMNNKSASFKELGSAIDQLILLGESKSSLCVQFLDNMKQRQSEYIQKLNIQLENQEQDMIEFIDLASREFLNELCLMMATYNDMFIDKASNESESVELNEFMMNSLNEYLDVIHKRLELEQRNGADVSTLVRALDRFFRRLQAAMSLLPSHNFASSGLEIILYSARRQVDFHLSLLKSYFIDLLTKVRQNLAAPRIASEDIGKHEESTNMAISRSLNEHLSSLVNIPIEKVKKSLHELLKFLHPDLTFNLTGEFKTTFSSTYVLDGLVLEFLTFILNTASKFCKSADKIPPALLLLLSKVCIEFESAGVKNLIGLTDELFKISGRKLNASKSQLCQEFHNAAQTLLDHYVRMQGLNISQMLRKSVETRDWLHTLEPRTVRAVMKRVVEDFSAIDIQVGTLYEEGSRKERSSDSSRKTRSVSRFYRNTWSSYAPSQLDSSLVTNIQKLFSERIDIFSSVDFSKVSILTGIVKIGLKTLLECVRLRTFSKFGLQQVQVDVHYLQLYLWRFVSDENLVHFLLDEILGSAVHRCLEPILMEPTVVEVICDRG